ncbi:DMT family transporter [Peribacillus saganii]|uniref:DMT family transporter n=1 Tax=Peribacillus saganii TaxID=2303992 RepID=A0A372LDH1_9BACI|nr:DMT family transporter [Peribacillus saganii]RFU64077.1 DMT family transporter [Peribacillus saganii]
MNKTMAADLTLLFVVFIWGVTFVMVQNAISFLEPFSFNFVRFFAAFLLLCLWYLAVLRRGQNERAGRTLAFSRDLIFSGMKLGGWLFLGYAFQTFGLLTTSPSKTGFITGLSVVLVPLFSLLLLKQKPSRNAMIGVALATSGLYFMTMVGSSAINFGDFLVFLCALSFAMHIVTTAKYAAKFSAICLTMVQIFTVALLSFVFTLFFEDISVIFDITVMLQPDVWGALVVTTVLATAFAFLAQTYFQTYTTPTRVALIFSMEPVFAAATSFIWINERLGPMAIAGCLLIFFGMIFSELPQTKSEREMESISKIS